MVIAIFQIIFLKKQIIWEFGWGICASRKFWLLIKAWKFLGVNNAA